MEKVTYLIIIVLSIVQAITCDQITESIKYAQKSTVPALKIPLDAIPSNIENSNRLRTDSSNIGTYNLNGNLENPGLYENESNNKKLSELRSLLLPNTPTFQSNSPGFAQNIPIFQPNAPGFTQNIPIFQANLPGFAENRPIYQPNYQQDGRLEHNINTRPNYYGSNGYDQRNRGLEQNIFTNPTDCIPQNSGLGSQVHTQTSYNSLGQNVISNPSYNGGLGQVNTLPNYNGGLGQVITQPNYNGGLGQSVFNRPSYNGGLGQNVISKPSYNQYYYPSPCRPFNEIINGYIYNKPSNPYPTPSRPIYTSTTTPFPPATSRLLLHSNLSPYKK